MPVTTSPRPMLQGRAVTRAMAGTGGSVARVGPVGAARGPAAVRVEITSAAAAKATRLGTGIAVARVPGTEETREATVKVRAMGVANRLPFGGRSTADMPMACQLVVRLRQAPSFPYAVVRPHITSYTDPVLLPSDTPL